MAALRTISRAWPHLKLEGNQLLVNRYFLQINRTWSSSNEVDEAKKVASTSRRPGTIFDKIIDGSIPARILYRDEKCLAFHDVNPQAPVHFLVIPIKTVTALEDASDDDKEVRCKWFFLVICNNMRILLSCLVIYCLLPKNWLQNRASLKDIA